ncbi:MAG: 2-amino-4-hydroxy-6-hydroxymethyldihydropteridine diphosphokinase [Alphaproteobacteria bacterium]|nr:2-amino-4-hydroxy-6-hydroxymethyldihydropteridine diphosphokinase [Alphaproteobacteria bacterium]
MILIAAGSSLPFCGIDSQQIVLSAFSALGRLTDLGAISPLYHTPAWPDPAEPPFVNAAAVIGTDLPPEALLAVLHAIEAGFGRLRQRKNAPRTLDLDLIAYGQDRRGGSSAVGDGAGLQLPHPRLAEREFVLAPLADIAADWRSPKTGKTVREMLAALPVRAAQQILR